MTKWITEYSKSHDFGLSAVYKTGDEITMDLISKFFEKKGAILLRTHLEDDEHYVIITNVDSDFVYIRDPYFLDASFYDNDKDVDIVLGRLFDYNRKVSIKRFNSIGKKDFALGPVKFRECTLIKRK